MIASHSETVRIVKAHDFLIKKRFGQNFLIDGNIVEKIVSSADICRDDFVIEIGPGIGGLTEALVNSAGNVLAIEIDSEMVRILRTQFSEYPNLEIINADVLKTDINSLVKEKSFGRTVKIVSNLPYYITTPIIMGMFENSVRFSSFTAMVQREVGDRIAARPSTKSYGALTLAVGFYAKVSVVCNVPAHSFYPQPNVDSLVIRLDAGTDYVQSSVNRDVLFMLIRAAFSQRRKTLINCLNNSTDIKLEKGDILKLLENCRLDEKIRGEALNLDEFIMLAGEYEKLLK